MKKTVDAKKAKKTLPKASPKKQVTKPAAKSIGKSLAKIPAVIKKIKNKILEKKPVKKTSIPKKNIPAAKVKPVQKTTTGKKPANAKKSSAVKAVTIKTKKTAVKIQKKEPAAPLIKKTAPLKKKTVKPALRKPVPVKPALAKPAPIKTTPAKLIAPKVEKLQTAQKKKTSAAKEIIKKAVKKPVASDLPKVKPANAMPAQVSKKIGRVVYLRKKHLPVQPKYFFENQIPENYGKTYIHAMMRDPECVFAYWEISSNSIEDIKTVVGLDVFELSKRIIKVLDITGIDYSGTNANSAFDLDVDKNANNWYIKVPAGERTYIIEYGCITPQGRYIMIARSNAVTTVSGRISDVIDDKWSSKETEALIIASKGAIRTIGASENLQLSGDKISTAESLALSGLFVGSSELNAPSSKNIM